MAAFAGQENHGRARAGADRNVCRIKIRTPHRMQCWPHQVQKQPTIFFVPYSRLSIKFKVSSRATAQIKEYGVEYNEGPTCDMPLCPSFTWQTYSVHYLRDLLFAYALLWCHALRLSLLNCSLWSCT